MICSRRNSTQIPEIRVLGTGSGPAFPFVYIKKTRIGQSGSNFWCERLCVSRWSGAVVSKILIEYSLYICVVQMVTVVIFSGG